MSIGYETPLFATQGGGTATLEGETYVWVETPKEFPEFNQGDPIPEEWSVVAINESARALEW